MLVLVGQTRVQRDREPNEGAWSDVQERAELMGHCRTYKLVGDIWLASWRHHNAELVIVGQSDAA